MNHIYKVIWNKAKNCYIVVSEIAKNHSTSSVTKKKVSIAAILVAGMLSGFSPMVSGAADTTNSEAVVYDQNKTSLKSTNSGSVGKNAIALGKGASAVANSIAIGNGAYTQDGNREKGQGVALGNGAVTGAKSTSIGNNAIGGREGTITIGANANNGALYSTVVGTDSKITSDGKAYTATLPFVGKKSVIVQGAVSTSYGAHNTITNEKKVFSGVANSISGSANTVTNSNGVTIQGTGNTVSNAYKDMDISWGDLWNFSDGDYSSLAKKDSGAIAIIGGGNTISNQTSSTVIGVGNILKGENSTGVFTAGSKNTLTNVSNSLVMGDNNTLRDRKNVISLGNNNTVGADDAVAIGNGTTVKAESGVAIGVGSVADRVAESEKGALGAFAPDTIPTGQESTWTSTKGAVSVGDTANNITRQITNVAAGREDTDAVNVAQLKQVASQAERANQGWNLTTNGVDAAATNVAPGGSVDFSGDDNVTVSNQDTKVKVSLNKDINVNSVQTNALNSKYNLSVGTAAADGKMPFFVNSNGAFYAAGSKFVVDKDGSVKATSGDIGNVKLNDGVFYKNTALRDGELYVGDADGNYSQITPKSAKLGQVTINEKGNMAGVNSIQTNALNAKYNLSVGTANENGTVPFFVNSNGAFYAANGKLVVDKDGKVTATEGEIGNVVLKNGVLYKNTALRDGELYVGDADGNYSQITPKSAKLGQVTIDEKGNMAGVNSVQTNALNAKYNLSVGTAADNGTMPFFVNSNGAFYAAGGEFVVDKDGSVKATSGDIGNVKLNDGVFYKNSALRDGELYVGDADGNYSQITSKNAKLGKVMIDDTGRISGVAAGRIAADSTDAINGSQLHAVQQEAGKHTKVVNGSNITVEETDQDGQKTYKVGLNKDLLLGDITGKNVSISGTNGTIETTGFIATKDKIYADKGAKLADVNVTGDTISNDKSSVKLDKEGTVTINNRVTIDQSGKISGVAAGEISSTSTDAVNGSQLKATNDRVSQVEGNITEIKGDITNIKSDITNIKGDVKNLGDRVTKVEQEAGKHTKVVNGSNVTVEETDQDGQKTYKVGLNKDLLLGDITGKNVSISGTNGTIETTGSIATKDKIYADKGAKLADIDITGDTISNGQSSVKLDKEGTVTINGKVSVNQDGKVSGVAAGDISEKSTDAVNGSQLFETKQQVAQNVQSISKLGNRINKVGAGAAALAALHPLDFDPDDKWDIAAGYGNYNGENAAAIGAYYRPNEDTMFSVGGSFGNGENMVNAGVSLKLGQGNHVSTSKVAMAKEIKDLRKELEGLKSALLDVNAGKKLDTSKLQLFPDVPKNHWAYEYVSTLKGNGALTGYPDGEFKGDRPMTRYEFATMLYKAMLEGATLSDKILKEFAPELERFTVDTVHQDKDGKPTVERVRTVKAEK